MNKLTCFVFIIILLLSVFSNNTIYAQKNKVNTTPNVVLILMDDLGYGDLECYGGSPYKMPNINKLAADGMRFNNYYAAQATCSASRASLLTGCYPNRIGISGALSPNSAIALNPAEETIASILKNKGYKTAMFGKWHLGQKAPFLPTSFGFDEFMGLPYSHDYWPVNYDGKPLDTSTARGRWPELRLIEGDAATQPLKNLDDISTLTTRYTERAVNFINKNKQQPFFLYLAEPMPHVPLAVSSKFKGKSAEGLFGDVMEEIDWSVGQIIKALEVNGLSKNTIVIFTSDNGPWLTYGNHAGNTGGLREGKGTAWDGGVKVPMLIKWPGHIKPASVCNNLAASMDILPTIATLCNAKLPTKKIDGINISTLLKSEAGANPRDEFAYYYDRCSLKGIRKGQWKLVFPNNSQTYKKITAVKNDGWPGTYASVPVSLALYNLRTDPGETLDVKEMFPDKLAELSQVADKYRMEIGDDLTKTIGTEIRPAAKVNTQKEQSRRPNIIYMMSDDHGYQAISAYGYNLNKTPNIDALASNGVLFTRAYVTNSICGPSRAVMLTGKHSHINGFKDNHDRFNGNQPTVAKIMHDAGYQTAIIGKWHLVSEPQGFDYWNIVPGQGEYNNPEFIENGVKKKVPGYVTNITTDFAINWLNGRDKEKPFFLVYQQKAPHRNWMPEEKYYHLFDSTTFPVPNNYLDKYETRTRAAKEQEMGVAKDMHYAYDLKLAFDLSPEERKGLALNWQNIYNRFTPEQKITWEKAYGPMIEQFKKANLSGDELAVWKYQRYMKDYLRCVQSVDDNVGRLMAYLKENGLEDNTIVIYTSDQGFYLGEHGWFDKRFMYEESFRTPLIVKWPGVTKGKMVSDKLVQNLDFAETILDIAGVAIPSDMQGKSIAPILKGKQQGNLHDAIYYHFYENQEHKVAKHIGIRTDRYKIIYFYENKEWELYDLLKDKHEMKNVYHDKKYTEVKSMMVKKLKSTKELYQDPLEISFE